MRKIMTAGLTTLLLNCVSQYNPPKQYSPNTKMELAQCLVKQEVTMYGAWWCDSCEKQKYSFGSEAWNTFKKNYVECSAEAGSVEERQRCQKEDLKYYPAWKFKDGTVVTGYKTLQELAELSKCD